MSELEVKPEEFTITNLFMKEVHQMDANKKRKDDLTKFVLYSTQVEQKLFDELCMCERYRIDLHIKFIPYKKIRKIDTKKKK